MNLIYKLWPYKWTVSTILLTILCGVLVREVLKPAPVCPKSTTRTVTVERVVNPDGTVTERQITADKIEAADSKKKYGAAALINPRDTQNFGLLGRYRLGETPFTLEGAVLLPEWQWLLGVGFEF